MRSGADHERAPAQGPPNPQDLLDGTRTFRVVLEDISSGIETNDSFAIKFALLTRSPLARMKHVVRRLPAKIWEGQGRSRAEHVLALIEEAGGKGRIVEKEVAPLEDPVNHAERPNCVKAPQAAQSCAMCGFPMKDDETRCGFCMTSVGDARPVDPRPEPAPPAKPISRTRLFVYAACLIVGLMLVMIFLR
jgi:hypothetical protein